MAKRVNVYNKIGKKINKTSKELIHNLKNGHKIEIVLDPKISMVNGGNTKIRYLKSKKLFKIYSFGSNWRDQEPTYHDSKYIYKYLVYVRLNGYFDGYKEYGTRIILY